MIGVLAALVLRIFFALLVIQLCRSLPDSRRWPFVVVGCVEMWLNCAIRASRRSPEIEATNIAA